MHLLHLIHDLPLQLHVPAQRTAYAQETSPGTTAPHKGDYGPPYLHYTINPHYGPHTQHITHATALVPKSASASMEYYSSRIRAGRRWRGVGAGRRLHQQMSASVPLVG